MDLQILNADDVRSIVKECALLRQFILATYWAPMEGSDIPVFRPRMDPDLDRQLVKWLLANGAPRYVRKEKP
jgi:hypothetical protein